MEAPKSKRFQEMRRQQAELTGEAVKATIKSRREGFLKRIFRFGGKNYQVSSVGQVQPEAVRSNRTK